MLALPLELIRHVLRLELQEGVEVVEEADERHVHGHVRRPTGVHRLGGTDDHRVRREARERRGSANSDDAKMMGITPAEFTLNGQVAALRQATRLEARAVVHRNLALRFLHVHDTEGGEKEGAEEDGEDGGAVSLLLRLAQRLTERRRETS